METAEYFESKGKYSHAVVLYEKMVPYVTGTDLASEIAYRSANANFKLEKYTLAGHQFKNFHTGFSSDKRAEDALYMSALCFYKGSGEYNLDQTNTKSAIREMQNFINTYPNSEKLAECNLMIQELQEKLEKKAFENAKTFYKTMKYKAAVVSFDNVMSDFPDSKLKEQAYYYSFLSKYELAKNSILDLQEERIKDAQTAIRLFEEEFPKSEYITKANQLKEKLDGLMVLHKEEIANRNKKKVTIK